VLVRKLEPKPIRIFLQSGTGDNNLYCGDWWMANQMMERSFTWAGYDVNHAWGEGGHNQKHASQIFPDVMRWLWRDWQTNKEIKANAKGESKWKGYEVLSDGDWKMVAEGFRSNLWDPTTIEADKEGNVLFTDGVETKQIGIDSKVGLRWPAEKVRAGGFQAMAYMKDGTLIAALPYMASHPGAITISPEGDSKRFDFHKKEVIRLWSSVGDIVVSYQGDIFMVMGQDSDSHIWTKRQDDWVFFGGASERDSERRALGLRHLALSPDQTLLYISSPAVNNVEACRLSTEDASPSPQRFYELDTDAAGHSDAKGMCVDTDGRLYVCTSLGVQVCDQAGRVNFIIPTPEQPSDICFGGKDLGDLFIITKEKIYKRSTKVHGIVSGQMPPIKPAAPKL
jgi:gluconolactonase